MEKVSRRKGICGCGRSVGSIDEIYENHQVGFPLPPSSCFETLFFSSDAFEPYLDIYVSFEQKEMNVLMARVQKSDNFEERNMVFESSQLMFDHFRQVMDTCASLSRGTAFVQIAELFRTNLRFEKGEKKEIV